MVMKEPETTAASEKQKPIEDRCPDHKFYPVRLNEPTDERAYYTLFVACPECGDFKEKMARYVWSDAA